MGHHSNRKSHLSGPWSTNKERERSADRSSQITRSQRRKSADARVTWFSSFLQYTFWNFLKLNLGSWGLQKKIFDIKKQCLQFFWRRNLCDLLILQRAAQVQGRAGSKNLFENEFKFRFWWMLRDHLLMMLASIGKFIHTKQNFVSFSDKISRVDSWKRNWNLSFGRLQKMQIKLGILSGPNVEV